MKNAQSKKIGALLLTCVMLFSFAFPAYAASSQVIFDGETFNFKPENRDLFINFKDIMPGDIAEQPIKLTNNSNKKTTFSLQMKIANQEKLSAEDSELIEELLFNPDLLNITITANGKEIYSEGAGGTQRKKLTEVGAHTSALIELGALSPKHYTNLNVICTVSKELDNRFASLAANVDWEFKATQPDDVTEPEDTTAGTTEPDITSPSDSTTEPTSVSGVTEATTKDNTLPELPSTGSRSIAGGVAIITVVAVAAFVLLAKRKNDEENK